MVNDRAMCLILVYVKKSDCSECIYKVWAGVFIFSHQELKSWNMGKDFYIRQENCISSYIKKKSR